MFKKNPPFYFKFVSSMALTLSVLGFSTDAVLAKEVTPTTLSTFNYDFSDAVDGYIRVQSVDKNNKPVPGMVYGIYNSANKLLDSRMTNQEGAVYFPSSFGEKMTVKLISASKSAQNDSFSKNVTITENAPLKQVTHSVALHDAVSDYDTTRSSLSLSNQSKRLSLTVHKKVLNGEDVIFKDNVLDAKYLFVRINNEEMNLVDAYKYINDLPNDATINLAFTGIDSSYTYSINGTTLSEENDYSISLDDISKINVDVVIPATASKGLNEDQNSNIDVNSIKVTYGEAVFGPAFATAVENSNATVDKADDKETSNDEADDKATAEDKSQATLESEALVKTIISEAKNLSYEEDSVGYSKLENKLLEQINTLKKNNYTDPFKTCDELNTVFPRGLEKGVYGYSVDLDKDATGVACGEKNGDRLNFSVYRIAFYNATANESSNTDKTATTLSADTTETAKSADEENTDSDDTTSKSEDSDVAFGFNKAESTDDDDESLEDTGSIDGASSSVSGTLPQTGVADNFITPVTLLALITGLLWILTNNRPKRYKHR